MKLLFLIALASACMIDTAAAQPYTEKRKAATVNDGFCPPHELRARRRPTPNAGTNNHTTPEPRMQSDTIETIASIRYTAADLLHKVEAGEISESEAWSRMLRRIVLAQEGVKLEKVS